MTDEQEKTQEKQGNAFGFSCCGDGSRTKPDHMEGCDCAGMMSRMMEMCGSAKPETATPEKSGKPDTIA